MSVKIIKINNEIIKSIHNGRLGRLNEFLASAMVIDPGGYCVICDQISK